jgi:MFS transporter, ACS family, solute carrier family 17 (sodium-dependent inorganic phosphate cotransporter), other
LGILGTGLFTAATPVMIKTGGFSLLILSRVIQGLLSGLAFPAINDVYSSYSPPWERSRTASYGIAGIFVGTIIAYALSGWLIRDFGWETVFYVFGIATVFWYLFWLVFVRSGPENDRLMSESEKNFIHEALKGQKSDIQIPWRSLFTSGPVYTIAFTHFCFNWGYYVLLAELPRYMVLVLGFNISVGGYLSAIPFLFQMIFIIFTAWFADHLIMTGKLTVTQVRKYFNNSALIIQALFLFIASFLYDADIVVVTLIALAVGASALAMPGFLSNSLDLAPQFSSIILGISNTFATIPGFASPSLTAVIIPDPENPTRGMTLI